jgi:hypothetical protein
MNYLQRITNFNPASIQDRYIIDPKSRIQKIPIGLMFPKVKGICGCGCRELLGKGKSRWANPDCMYFANTVREIICGYTSTIKLVMKMDRTWKCVNCHRVRSLKIDHIIPVKHGGGGCWLENYQLLCQKCHVVKTREDFGWKGKIQLSSKKGINIVKK